MSDKTNFSDILDLMIEAKLAKMKIKAEVDFIASKRDYVKKAMVRYERADDVIQEIYERVNQDENRAQRFKETWGQYYT